MTWATRRGRRDDGVTLVELLVAISIMSIAIVTIVGGLGVYFRSARVYRSNADLDHNLRTHVEQLLDAAYDPCPANYPIVEPDGVQVDHDVTYWTGGNPITFGTACSSDAGLQRITVTVTDPVTDSTDALTVVKRNS